MADVQGLDQLAAAIAAMNAQLQAELPAIALAGADIVAAEIEPRIPRRTGELASSLDEEPGAGRHSASATVEIVQSGPGGQEHKAIFLEYGTSKMAARPFFRPGVEAAKPKVEAVMAAEIQNVIGSHDR